MNSRVLVVGLPASVEKNNSFYLSLGHATQQQKLQSSPRSGVLKADFPTCLLIRRSAFFSQHTGTAANLRTEILDFRGFDSSIILISRGVILMSVRNFPVWILASSSLATVVTSSIVCYTTLYHITLYHDISMK